MTPRNPQIKHRLNSFKHAFEGFKTLLKEEPNVRIHLLAAIGAIIAGFVLHVSSFEWLVLIFAIGWVLALELVNSVIERLADFVSPDKHEAIKKIKDISAAAVLVSAITALVAGLIIFIPKI